MKYFYINIFVFILCSDFIESFSVSNQRRLQFRQNKYKQRVEDGNSCCLTSRYDFLTCLFINLALVSSKPPVALATRDYSANIKIPSYIDFLVERNSSVDKTKILYQGIDSEVQLKRIADATIRLQQIPEIAQQKKWSEVQGILTGPLGTLLQTMTALSKSSDVAQKAAAKVKGDLLTIGKEATNKNVENVIGATERALSDLESFAKIVF